MVVGVPGPWADRDALFAAVMQAGMPPRFMLAGLVFMEVGTKQGCTVDFYPANPEIGQIMAQRSGGTIEHALMQQISKNQSVVYLVSQEHSVAAATAMVRAVDFLLEIGGFAVSVESTGMAVHPDKWRALARRNTAVSAMEALVTLVGGEDECYSCGMHNLGLPDCAVPTAGMEERSIPECITAFNHYQLHGESTPKEGDVFALSATEPTSTMHLQPYGYEEDNLLNNPFGRWFLKPAPISGTIKSEDSIDEPVFVGVKKDSEDMAKARRDAQQTLSRLLDFHKEPHEYGMALFKVHLVDGTESAHMWLRLTETDEHTVTGQCFELPAAFTRITLESVLTFPHHEVEDWCIRKAGLLVGGFTTRFQRDRLDETQRRKMDLHMGNVAYAPVADLQRDASPGSSAPSPAKTAPKPEPKEFAGTPMFDSVSGKKPWWKIW